MQGIKSAKLEIANFSKGHIFGFFILVSYHLGIIKQNFECILPCHLLNGVSTWIGLKFCGVILYGFPFKKTSAKFDFTTMVPHVELLSFVFWEN